MSREKIQETGRKRALLLFTEDLILIFSGAIMLLFVLFLIHEARPVRLLRIAIFLGTILNIIIAIRLMGREQWVTAGIALFTAVITGGLYTYFLLN